MPTQEEAAALQLPAGHPRACRPAHPVRHRGRAVEVNDMTLSGDRYKLSYEIPAE
jgi:DNA-binding GntR family transcriptional regulator